MVVNIKLVNMLNADQLKTLRNIGKEIPKSMKDAAMVKYNATADLKERVEKYRDDKRLPKEVREKFARELDSGRYDKIGERVDQKKQDEIMKMADYRLNKHIKEGRLPDPKKIGKTDKFLNEQIYAKKESHDPTR